MSDKVFHVWGMDLPWPIVEETLTSGKYISLFLILILFIYIYKI